ncbi:MAG TPA: hypothetical protein VN132_04755, partial [Bdellovibrio sp.]|nr:hypothetical protein [Bdellovibrio sp.]
MKKQTGLLLTATLMQMGLAHAGDSIFVKEIADHSTSSNRVHVEFRANTESPELGRAWLTASYSQTALSDADTVPPKAEKILVPGLSYSAANKQILYKKTDGTSVVCADNVTDAIFTSGYRITGHCVIETVASTI